MARRTLRFRLLLTVAALAAFPLLEIGLRLGGFWYPSPDRPVSIWNPAEDRAMRFGAGMFTTAPRQLWVPRPGAKVAWGEDERINEAGYRGPLRKPGDTPDVLRVLILGESCAFGYGVDYADTYANQLEQKLRETGREVEVIDAGVVGYTLRQGLERYRAFGRDYKPDVVVEAFGEVNEHFGSGGPMDAQKIEMPLAEGGAWTEIVQLFRQRVRIAHWVARILDGMSAERLREREREFSRLSYENDLQSRMGEIDWPGERRVPVADFEAAMLALAKDVASDGARFVMLSPPRRRAIEETSPALRLYTESIENLSRLENIPLADGHRAFRDAEDHGTKEDELFRDAWHFTRAGHGELARVLAEKIVELDPTR